MENCAYLRKNPGYAPVVEVAVVVVVAVIVEVVVAVEVTVEVTVEMVVVVVVAVVVATTHNSPRLTNPWPSNSRSNCNLEMLIFEEGGKLENPEKTNNKLNPQ